MRKITDIFLLLPIFLYAVLFILNRDLVQIQERINVFWLWDINVPIVSVITLFFVIYIVIIWLLFKFSHIFLFMKKKRLETKVSNLKAELQDGQ
jgi:hypothetical protein